VKRGVKSDHFATIILRLNQAKSINRFQIQRGKFRKKEDICVILKCLPIDYYFIVAREENKTWRSKMMS
jgi:hypothetical protein